MEARNEAAVEIGRIIKNARLRQGYVSRASLVDTKTLRGKITGEGLRKIEEGERVPRMENIRLLAKALKLDENPVLVRKLENLAVRQYVTRAARKAGNCAIEFKINGTPMQVLPLPPKRKSEAFVRAVVEDLVKIVDKYGVMQEDLEHFRRHARAQILSRLGNDPTDAH